ncbi:MAG: redoxin domain-containing protein [Bacteroidia bacterium]|jgi:peroxiredoxin
MLQVGQNAPDFTLFNAEKESITLSQFKGRNVVLLFFPKAFTGVCTKEFCDVRDNIHVYQNLNAEIIAISVDPESTLAEWKASESYNFQMLSDSNKDVSRTYDTIYDTGVSKRSAFVIDSEGTLRHIDVLENAGEIPSFEDILNVLSTLN